MTRPDVKKKHLGEFLDWSLSAISQNNGKTVIEITELDGVLQSLVNTAPIIKRACLCVYVCVRGGRLSVRAQFCSTCRV